MKNLPALILAAISFTAVALCASGCVKTDPVCPDGATQAGDPREDKEKESCRRLGKRLAEWVAVYVDGRKELHPLKDHYKRNP